MLTAVRTSIGIRTTKYAREDAPIQINEVAQMNLGSYQGTTMSVFRAQRQSEARTVWKTFFSSPT